MAERRMFSKKVTDSDQFIEMSDAACKRYGTRPCVAVRLTGVKEE